MATQAELEKELEKIVTELEVVDKHISSEHATLNTIDELLYVVNKSIATLKKERTVLKEREREILIELGVLTAGSKE